MPNTANPNGPAPSPADIVLKMIQGIRDQPSMKQDAKISELAEIGTERITFHAPEQALKIISALGQVISSDPDPKVRAEALQVMERMIDLEAKAEEHGQPKMDWRLADMLLNNAKKEVKLDAPVADLAGVSPKPAPIVPGDAPAPSLSGPSRPHPHGMEFLADEHVSPASFMKLLRSVAEVASEKDLRALAKRMIEKIEKQSVAAAPMMQAPTLTEG